MEPSDLRIALFSGNYNYVRDGANQALNRLVVYLLRQGVNVRVYSAVSDTPAFEPAGDLVPVRSVPFPGRGEYRVALGLPAAARADIARFRPNLYHLAAPDLLGHRAQALAHRTGVPVVASVHTRFETYFDYYRLGWIRGGVEALLRRFYRGCAEIYAPSESMADTLRAQGMSERVLIWSRGVDKALFRPSARDLGWRRSLGIGDEEAVLGFVGRLVLEKGLDVVAATSARLEAQGVPHRLLVVGDGPARDWLAQRAPQASFAGFLTGPDLARAYASMDMMINPSVTETFGNVTLEAMASGLPVVAASATGAASLVEDGANGVLLPPKDIDAFAAAVGTYVRNPLLRRRHGEEGLRRAQRYDWDAINRRLLCRYLEVAFGGAAASAPSQDEPARLYA